MISDVATVKCPICGKPYKIYASCTGDQSACPACQEEAEQSVRRSRMAPTFGYPYTTQDTTGDAQDLVLIHRPSAIS